MIFKQNLECEKCEKSLQEDLSGSWLVFGIDVCEMEVCKVGQYCHDCAIKTRDNWERSLDDLLIADTTLNWLAGALAWPQMEGYIIKYNWPDKSKLVKVLRILESLSKLRTDKYAYENMKNNGEL